MKKTVRIIPFLLLLIMWGPEASAQYNKDDVFQVKGFCINAPSPQGLDRFVKFIGDELAAKAYSVAFCLEEASDAECE